MKKKQEKRKNASKKTSFGNLPRSELMSLIRSKGNKSTEEKLAKILKREKLSGWRRHINLLGKPDFTWIKNKVAVFVDGCFWHGHECGRNLRPKTNAKYWREKINRNKVRDKSISRKLRKEGWTVIRIWECRLEKSPKSCVAKIKNALSKVISGDGS